MLNIIHVSPHADGPAPQCKFCDQPLVPGESALQDDDGALFCSIHCANRCATFDAEPRDVGTEVKP